MTLPKKLKLTRTVTPYCRFLSLVPAKHREDMSKMRDWWKGEKKSGSQPTAAEAYNAVIEEGWLPASVPFRKFKYWLYN